MTQVQLTSEFGRLSSGPICKHANIPFRVVHLGLSAKQFLLAGLVGIVSSDLITVLLGLKERDQVNPRPHLLSCELTVEEK